ncbi:MAG: polysaccharide deacetylase family protein [Bacteroidetes bacterium]|nr:polysaccharide deacetylase family protein [Bacteroidota bacterium]
MNDEKNILWDVFTAKSEYSAAEKDEYGRVSSKFTSNKELLYPVVSKYLHKSGFQPTYPGNRKFAVCLTHDVDLLAKYDPNYRYVPHSFENKVRHTAKKILGIKEPVQLNPDWRLEKMISLDKKYNATATYFFLALKKNEKDFNYELEQIKYLFPLLVNSGCEIGLHGSHEAYRNLSGMIREKNTLQEIAKTKIAGYRNHFLRFSIPETWSHLASAGFVYDTTFGFADHIGFRNGMCYPFSPFNVKTGNFFDLLELPLVIMDVSLFHYMRFSYRDALEQCCRLIDEVESCRGVLTFLWHNNYVTGEMGEFYESILKYVYNKNGWMTSAIDLVKWWREKQYSQLMQELLHTLKQ